jgi:hypothetical protein
MSGQQRARGGRVTPKGVGNGGAPVANTLPVDLFVERALIGCALDGWPPAIADVVALGPDVFASTVCQRYARSICRMVAEGIEVDAITTFDVVRNDGEGWDEAVDREAFSQILTHARTAGHVARYAHIVRRTYAQRIIALRAEEARQAAIEGRLDDAHAAIVAITERESLAIGPYRWDTLVGLDDDDGLEPTLMERTDGKALLYPGCLHWLMGAPGKGKTWAAMIAVAQLIAEGRRVAMWDYEGNRKSIRARLRALGCTEANLASLHYDRPRVLDRTAVAAAIKAAGPVELVVIDSCAKAMGRQGLDEDKAADVLAWLELMVWPWCEAEAAVVVIDHVVKDTESRGLWPRGSGAKQGEVDGAAYAVQAISTWSREAGGAAKLVIAKDREGHVGAEGQVAAELSISVDPFLASLRPPEGGGQRGTTFSPTVLMERVSRALETGPARTSTWLRDHVRGKATGIDMAVEQLVADGYLAEEQQGQTSWFTSVRPYRRDAESA